MREERKTNRLRMFVEYAAQYDGGDVPAGERAGFQWSRYLLPSLLIVTGSLGSLSPGNARAGEQSATTGKVVAKVNGKPIYAEQLQPAVEKRLETFRKFGMRNEDPDLVKRLQGKALDQIIDNELVRQESRKLTIEGLDEKVEQKVKAMEKKFGAGKGMDFYLKRRKLTMEDLRKSLHARVQIEEYLKKQGILDPEIPEDRIREAYAASPESYSRTDETVQVSHILIAVDADAGTEKKEQAKQKAERIRTEILGGKDFAEMAKEHSDCNSAAGGGRLRSFKRGFMPKEFDEVAFALDKDAVSEVVETRFGYHIIKVLDKKPAGVLPYEKVRDFIKKFLQEKETKRKLAAHIAELKKEAKIEVLLK